MPQPATAAPGNTVIPLTPGTANAPAAGNDAGKNDIGKTATANEQKATDNAKSVIKRLENGGDQITLEDLNAARQTVARIDAMIDVEKHLAELEKIRSERTGESRASSAALAGAIPASALDPLPMPAQNTMPVFVPRGNRVETPPHPVEKPKGGWEKTEISRISGTEGKYSAVLKMADGTLKPAKVGDQIGDHMTVRWITSSTVLVEESGETHTLRVKGVDAIYSAMR
jgi:type IV pilus biogenesis protein PilP